MSHRQIHWFWPELLPLLAIAACIALIYRLCELPKSLHQLLCVINDKLPDLEPMRFLSLDVAWTVGAAFVNLHKMAMASVPIWE
jgi:hypothetical protein